MENGNLVRLGGVFGLLAVLFMISAYVVGYPDAPGSPVEASSYFDIGVGAFVFLNGVLPLFHIFFFVLFLGVLCGVLRQAEGGAQGGGIWLAALAGGLVYAALTSAGLATEIAYPATLARFGNLEAGAPFVLVTLTLSSWLYHFCQVGTSAMVLSVSLLGLGTGVLPRWLALAGFVVALLALLHFLLPLLGALAGLAWVAVVSALMVAGGVRYGGVTRTPREVNG